MTDSLYRNFYKRWDEVTQLPPQRLGILTPAYKKVIPLFKNAPWRIIVPLVLVSVTAGVFVLQGITATQIASLLQGGF